MRTFNFQLLWALPATLFVTAALQADEVTKVDVNHAYVQGLAKERASKAYAPRTSELSPVLQKLSYDDYMRIRFNPDSSLWKGNNLPFRVQFFHPGWLHQTPVVMNEFSKGYSQHLPFIRTFFDYSDLKLNAPLPGSLEYAGFRLLAPLNRKERWDEVISFLGASYFRALGREQFYGLSARGLGLNTGGPGAEEFPSFVEFWIGKPSADAKSVTLHALLDSASVSGAYTFILTPGDDTVMDVQATLFFRKRVENLGLAPLTSMFWFGKTGNDFGDFRGEVHDSDGLLIAPEGERRVWRPLVNPKNVRTVDFPAAAPVGFGLMQRERAYRNYEDPQARYEARPSVWVERVGEWPAGRVRLLEIPTTDEYSDNIVAYWAPHAAAEAGQSMEVHYRLHWTKAPTAGGPAGWVRSTRRGDHVDRRAGRTRFIIDFNGLEKVASTAAVAADVTVPSNVTLVEKQVFQNEVDGSWRLALLLDAAENQTPVEVSAQLSLDGKSLTETWVGTWQP